MFNFWVFEQPRYLVQNPKRQYIYGGSGGIQILHFFYGVRYKIMLDYICNHKVILRGTLDTNRITRSRSHRTILRTKHPNFVRLPWAIKA